MTGFAFKRHRYKKTFRISAFGYHRESVSMKGHGKKCQSAIILSLNHCPDCKKAFYSRYCPKCGLDGDETHRLITK